jgi:hypothetical protein
MEVAEIEVSADAGEVVIEFKDHATQESTRWRISPSEARALAVALRAMSDSFAGTA